MRIDLLCSCGATFTATDCEDAELAERLRAEFNEPHSLCRKAYAFAMIQHGQGASAPEGDGSTLCGCATLEWKPEHYRLKHHPDCGKGK